MKIKFYNRMVGPIMRNCVEFMSESLGTKQTRRRGVRVWYEFVCRDLDEEIGKNVTSRRSISKR